MSFVAQASLRSIAATQEAWAGAKDNGAKRMLTKASLLIVCARCFSGSFGGMLLAARIDSNHDKSIGVERTTTSTHGGEQRSKIQKGQADEKENFVIVVPNQSEARASDLVNMEALDEPHLKTNNSSPHSSNSSGQHTASLSLSDAVTLQGSSANSATSTQLSQMTASTSRRNFVRLLNRRRGRRSSVSSVSSAVPQTVEIRSHNSLQQFMHNRRKSTNSSKRRTKAGRRKTIAGEGGNSTATRSTVVSPTSSLSSSTSSAVSGYYRNRGPESYA